MHLKQRLGWYNVLALPWLCCIHPDSIQMHTHTSCASAICPLIISTSRGSLMTVRRHLFRVLSHRLGGPLQSSRSCFDDREDLHFTPRHKTVPRLSFLPARLNGLEWKGCLSYGLCLGQKKNKNAIQLRHVTDVKEDCLARMCGEFKGDWPGKRLLCAQVCLFSGCSCNAYVCVCVCTCYSSNLH